MTEDNSTDIHWDEQCSFKLDIALSGIEDIKTRLGEIVSMLFSTKEYLTAEEAALFIGVTKSHFYKVARQYDIQPCSPKGCKHLYTKDEIKRKYICNQQNMQENDATEIMDWTVAEGGMNPEAATVTQK